MEEFTNMAENKDNRKESKFKNILYRNIKVIVFLII